MAMLQWQAEHRLAATMSNDRTGDKASVECRLVPVPFTHIAIVQVVARNARDRPKSESHIAHFSATKQPLDAT
jgi:hypothetical protein